ncbi:zwei Ig domain protein zig-8-like [Mercenaria mercenaria]|uniref:zwei Ig domain protein zig-8-like n=1 Tax=Mercenaria mercenaria TaxID=6596 RepID=UPI00234E5216|nr:zwei Ig domain protein zig-8-like [Mercenaria mercenaria]
MDFILYMIFLLLSLEQVVTVPLARRRKLQPTFLPTPTNITVHRGELAVLKCHIKDVGPKMVVWREQARDVPLTIGQEIFSPENNMAIEVHKISEHETQYDLIIKDVETHHSGTYLCQVTATKLYTHYVTLTVLDEPIKVEKRIKLTGTEFVNQDSRIMLRCNVTGALHAPDDVDWFFKGERIMTQLPHWRDRTQILRRTMGRMYISELIVDRSTLEDDGIYVCRSSGSSIDVEDITVNVLSADKPNVSRRDKANLSQTGDIGPSSSAMVVFQHSSMVYILTLISYVMISLTSNGFTRLTTHTLNLSRTVFNCDNCVYR